MGRELVYCRACGRGLREEEFEKGRAHRVEQIPYCSSCRPPDATPPTGAHKIVKPVRPGTDRVPGASRRPRPAPAKGPPLPLILSVVVGAALLLVLVAFALGRGR
jgi:hypothetical protein